MLYKHSYTNLERPDFSYDQTLYYLLEVTQYTILVTRKVQIRLCINFTMYLIYRLDFTNYSEWNQSHMNCKITSSILTKTWAYRVK